MKRLSATLILSFALQAICFAQGEKPLYKHFEDQKSQDIQVTQVSDTTHRAAYDDPEALQIHVQVYPNPASNEIRIQTELLPGNFTLSIINASGSLVVLDENYMLGNSIAVNELLPGTYLLYLNKNNLQWSTRFVKQ